MVFSIVKKIIVRTGLNWGHGFVAIALTAVSAMWYLQTLKVDRLESAVDAAETRNAALDRQLQEMRSEVLLSQELRDSLEQRLMEMGRQNSEIRLSLNQDLHALLAEREQILSQAPSGERDENYIRLHRDATRRILDSMWETYRQSTTDASRPP